MKKIIFFVGTRPEAIKLASVVRYFRQHGQGIHVLLCSTGQHKEMLAQALSDFELTPDFNFALMQSSQSLSSLSAKLFENVDGLLNSEKPDWVMVQGDTTTAMITSLCAFYHGIKIAHVEAGLRSFDRLHPFPEEINRRVVGLVTDNHFAPTVLARKNLLREGVSLNNITVTGNTVIDALLWMVDTIRQDPPELPKEMEHVLADHHPYVLITGHRRESFGEGFNNICLAIRDLAEMFPQIRFVYPVHLNPNVQKPVMNILKSVSGVLLLPPQSYKPFIRLMDNCRLILTDSGGIQEEGPSLGKPVLVMRDVTERPEGIQAGTSKLVGTRRESIVEGVANILIHTGQDSKTYRVKNPYGDGTASKKIFDAMITSW